MDAICYFITNTRVNCTIDHYFTPTVFSNKFVRSSSKYQKAPGVNSFFYIISSVLTLVLLYNVFFPALSLPVTSDLQVLQRL